MNSALVLFALLVAPEAAFDWNSFSATQLADPAISGWNADPDHDGWINLLEYAFAYLPLAGNANAAPTVGTDEDHLTLTYPKNKTVTDLTIVVATSSDLVNWSNAPADVELDRQFIDGDTRQRITARDQAPVSSTTRRFMRIKVKLP